jgi:predicted 3-demethylubiquinone-9 3-methyltransferase (glyoxalase superfamily)
MMQKITPCLWFDTNGEEALDFYVSILKEAEITNKSYYGDAGPLPKGTMMTGHFRFSGQDFMILVGGPEFKFSEAVSLVINCDDQAEVDYYWKALLKDGGKESQCGWLKDKYGFSWQVTPKIIQKLQDAFDGTS